MWITLSLNDIGSLAADHKAGLKHTNLLKNGIAKSVNIEHNYRRSLILEYYRRSLILECGLVITALYKCIVNEQTTITGQVETKFTTFVDFSSFYLTV